MSFVLGIFVMEGKKLRSVERGAGSPMLAPKSLEGEGRLAISTLEFCSAKGLHSGGDVPYKFWK